MSPLVQMGEHEAFIHELLQQLTATIQHLESHQIHMFYEAVGLMVGAEHLEPKRNEYLVRPQACVRLLKSSLIVLCLTCPSHLFVGLFVGVSAGIFTCGNLLRCSGFSSGSCKGL